MKRFFYKLLNKILVVNVNKRKKLNLIVIDINGLTQKYFELYSRDSFILLVNLVRKSVVRLNTKTNLTAQVAMQVAAMQQAV